MGKTDMISRSTYDRMKEEYGDKLTKASEKVKALADSGDGTAVDGLRSVAVGAAVAVMDRWRVKLPASVPLIGDSVSPVSMAFTAGWPLVRKGLSKTVRKFGDQAWTFGLSKFGYNGASSALDSMMKS